MAMNLLKCPLNRNPRSWNSKRLSPTNTFKCGTTNSRGCWHVRGVPQNPSLWFSYFKERRPWGLPWPYSGEDAGPVVLCIPINCERRR